MITAPGAPIGLPATPTTREGWGGTDGGWTTPARAGWTAIGVVMDGGGRDMGSVPKGEGGDTPPGAAALGKGTGAPGGGQRGEL